MFMQIYVKSANKQVINVSLFCFESNLRFDFWTKYSFASEQYF